MNNYYFDWYRFYNNLVMKLIRFTVLIGAAAILFLTIHDELVFQTVLVIYTLFLINEIFVYFKINKCFPLEKVTENKGHAENSTLFKVRNLLSGNTSVLIKRLLSEPDVQFLVNKLGEYRNPNIQIDRNILLDKALDFAKRAQGNYITAADILTAYIVLTEAETKILLEKELTENDFLEILLWTREKFKLDIKGRMALHFTGYGIFDFFIYGWNTLIKEYAFDITYTSISQQETTIVGREEEFKQMITALSKNSAHNVLLIGEPGVGKTSLVKKLARDSYTDTNFILSHVTIFELLVDRVLAGVENAGQLEERLTLLLAELAHSGNTILFIQNIENVFGGGGFNFDMSGILFEYLKSEKIQIIGTTTPAFYKSVIEKKVSILHLFEKIRIEEPKREVTFKIIAAHVDVIENDFKVSVSYKAIHESIELSTNYLPNIVLPGKAISLLQDACSQVRLSGGKEVGKKDVISVIQSKTHIILEKPTDDEKQMLLSLENELHKQVVGQNEAIDAIAKAIRRLRSGFSQHARPISVFLFLGPTGVGKTETAKALARQYFGDENAMIRLDMSEYQTQNEVERLLGGIPGGGEIQNSLPEAVMLHPFSLVLLDEFEKAHPHILDVFLQIFEDGRLTDNQGRTISFKNTIIIATSNAGSEKIRQMVKSGTNEQELKQVLIEDLLKSGQFKPELLNRFDDVIVFKPLTETEAEEVARLLLINSLKTLEDQQIYISFDEKAVQKVVRESFDQEAGARNMRRYIGGTVEDFISRFILEDKISRGAHIVLSTNETGEFVLQ